ncbi:S41 family peptidase [Phnomibacter ginsenosidimutans]|uniref:Tail specific protease domain-containing protein n=1 Tax=Phnomibacter ginsenosidimutans TaxID=2676868 RepID=A0A6I6GA24_9BACT|nr:S41 family peptidase [Phnomibacter ginsenosidimutans]QGW28423.1 hypothetical protein GLV81_10225 [Phnomibacter ginsenosidimutans]
MMRMQLIWLLALTSLTSMGQETVCNCLDNLQQTIRKTEENYAGFPAKVTASNLQHYQALVKKLRHKAAQVTNTKNCYYILSQYIHFFKDKHFILAYNNEKDFDSTVLQTPANYWQDGTTQRTLAPVEGIWMNADSTVTIGIQQSGKGVYQAVKIESSIDNFPKGFVYFTLTANKDQFMVKEYNSFISTASPAMQRGNLLQLWNHALWGKVYPQHITPQEKAELNSWKNNNNGIVCTQLQPNVAYLKIPSFTRTDEIIQQVVAANDSMIRSNKYLIVDLRGNGGGNTGWIYFLPYFMTHPIEQYPSLLRVTPENVQHKLKDLAPFVEQPISSDYAKYFPAPILAAYKKAYAELPVTKSRFYPIPGVTFPLDSITKNPAKIALVVDGFCGSSTEYFFYLSKQSKKVTTYGSNTIGMMDYEGMSVPTALPCQQFILTIPITQSSWTDTKPIDNTGFTPDVVIPLPQEKWLDYIIKDLQKK